jgi:hypothetical protein
MLPPRPKSLAITAEPWTFYSGGPERRVLVGTDENGQKWTVRWCGNGAHSHWVLTPISPVNEPGEGYYVFRYPEDYERELKDQIEAAELKYRIF